MDIPIQDLRKLRKLFGVDHIFEKKPKNYYTVTELINIIKCSRRRIQKILKYKKTPYILFYTKNVNNRNLVLRAYEYKH